MSYTKLTSFTPKDTLLSGNPNKLVRGSELDAEFDAIAAAYSNVDNTSDATKNAATATLTNKTVNLTNNTLTGTIAQFNTACSDADFATGGGTATGTNTGDQTNITGNAATATSVAVGGITGLGTGVATALATNVGSAGAPVVNGGALGTPSSGSAANLTSFPTLNQNTTGTAGGLTGTPNISVGTVGASGQINTTAGILLVNGISSPYLDLVSSGDASYKVRLQAVYSGTATLQLYNRTTLALSSGGIDGTKLYGPSGTAVVTATDTGLAITGALSATGTVTGSALTSMNPSGAGTLILSTGLASAGRYRNWGLYTNDGAFGNLTIRQSTAEGGDPLAAGTAIGTITSTGLAVTGALSATGLLDLSGAAAGQIKFPATQNASADPNTLDDYDEYTAASAACTGAITTAAVWKLTKTGNQVTLTVPAVTGTASGSTFYIAFGTVIPAKYRPVGPVTSTHLSVQNGIYSLSACTISNAGAISFYATPGLTTTNYTNGQVVGSGNDFTASWTI